MAPFRLLDLPDELIVDIVQTFTTFLDLRALACTCRHLQAIAEPRIYGRIFIRTESQAVALHEALDTTTWRAKAVVAFEARCEFKKFPNVNLCSDIVRKLPNLQEYTVESPYCNSARWRAPQCRRRWAFHHTQLMNVFQDSSCLPQNQMQISERPLKNLRKLILHLNGINGNEFWTFGPAESGIFAHPTLEELQISSVNLLKDTRNYIPLVRSTPLKSLFLEECNITGEALTGILSHPAGLSSLHIGEAINCQDFIGTRMISTIKNKMSFFLALGQQKESLESLCYITCRDPDWYQRPVAALIADEHGLAGHVNLKSLDLTHGCAHLEQILTIQRTAPPNLRTLFLRASWYGKVKISLGAWNRDDQPGDLQSDVEKIVGSLDKLEDLHIILPPPSVGRISSTIRDQLENTCRNWTSDWKNRNLRVRVHVEAMNKGFVPPILFGEVPHPDVLIFDSRTGIFDVDPLKDTRFPFFSELEESDSDFDDDEESEDDDNYDDDDDDDDDDDEGDEDDDNEIDEIDDGFGDVDADLNMEDGSDQIGFADARSWETVSESD